MEFIHAAKFLQEWFDGLPSDVKIWVVRVCWVLVPAIVALLIYTVVREEKISESGKVSVKWYHPSQWFARYMQIQADNEAKSVQNGSNFYIRLQQLLALNRQLSEIAYDVIFLMVGLLGLLGVLLSLMINTWWVLIPSAIAVYIGVQSWRKLRNRTRKKDK
jgi:hypothetical protein